jgi:hypothetical protein
MQCKVEQDLNRYMEERDRQDEKGESREVLRSEAENNCLYDDEAASDLFYERLLEDEGMLSEIKKLVKAINTAPPFVSLPLKQASAASDFYVYIIQALSVGTNVEDEIDKLANR